jgi:8-oxo-dGTP pyrophosphatase MutT (NUDIX family)
LAYSPAFMSAVRRKVQVWIHCRAPGSGDLRVLVLKTNAARESFWQPVTGKIEPGEELEEAALREAREETGLIFTARPEPLGEPFEFISYGARNVETGFSLRAEAGEGCLPGVRIDPKEHQEWEWVVPEEALARIRYPSNKDLLRILMEKEGA